MKFLFERKYKDRTDFHFIDGTTEMIKRVPYQSQGRNLPDFETLNSHGELHSFNDEPSQQFKDGETLLFHKGGILHRELGPAVLEFNPVHNIYRLVYFNNGKRITDDAHTILSKVVAGEFIPYEFKVDDIIYNPTEYKKYIFRKKLDLI